MTLVAFLNGSWKNVQLRNTSPSSYSGAKELVSGYIKSRFKSSATWRRPLLRKQPVGLLIGLSATYDLGRTGFEHSFATARNVSGCVVAASGGGRVERDVRLDHDHVALFDEPFHAAERAQDGADGLARGPCRGRWRATGRVLLGSSA